MQTRDYLKYIVEEIHSAVFATVDGEGHPVTCAIDIMDYDESGLYFLTAKGKNFYERLKANENIAFTAMKGEDTLSCVALSVQGRAKEIGPDRLFLRRRTGKGNRLLCDGQVHWVQAVLFQMPPEVH